MTVIVLWLFLTVPWFGLQSVTRLPKACALCTLANSEEPDEMPHSVAFHQDLHCLIRQNQSSEKEIQHFLEIITGDPLIYTMNNPDFIVCSFMLSPLIGLKRGF